MNDATASLFCSLSLYLSLVGTVQRLMRDRRTLQLLFTFHWLRLKGRTTTRSPTDSFSTRTGLCGRLQPLTALALPTTHHHHHSLTHSLTRLFTRLLTHLFSCPPTNYCRTAITTTACLSTQPTPQPTTLIICAFHFISFMRGVHSYSAFDVGVESDSKLFISGPDPVFDYFLFPGPDPAAVIAQFTGICGRMSLPPKWALGLKYDPDDAEQNQVRCTSCVVASGSRWLRQWLWGCDNVCACCAWWVVGVWDVCL
jgi:hypothetical protein